MNETPFERNRRIIAEFLALCHRFYEGAMGPDGHDPSKSRMALDAKDVAMDMADALRVTYFRLDEPPQASSEEGP